MSAALRPITSLALAATLAAGLALSPVAADARAERPRDGHQHGVSTVLDGLDGPRGVDATGHGAVVVSESDGTFSVVLTRGRGRHRDPVVIELGSVAPGFAPAVAVGRGGRVFVLTGAGGEPGGEPAPGSSTLYEWRPGWDEPRPLADIGAYQATDPDPADLEGLPGESNPFGLAALRDGSVLVADAAGNDLLRVSARGNVSTVATLLPRQVPVPEGLPATDPDGNPLPPAGAVIPSEAVATSVTVGPDGAWYVGELRGFPATPGTSQIWRVEPGSRGAVCDPEHPRTGRCTRHADGLTSIVDLAADRHGLLALSLSKASWLALELGIEGADVGGLFRVRRHQAPVELARDQLRSPGGVDSTGGHVYVTGPVFGPGSLLEVS